MTEQAISIIQTICGTYSYSATTRKYRRTDGRVFKAEEAVSEVVNTLAVQHPNVYVEVSTSKEELADKIKETLIEATHKKKKAQTITLAANTKAGTLSTGVSSKTEENPLWKADKAFNAVDGDWCGGLFLDENNILYRQKKNGAYEIMGSVSSKTNDTLASMLERKQQMPNVHEFVKAQLGIMSMFASKAQEMVQEGPKALLDLTLPAPTAEDADNRITLRDWLGIDQTNEPKDIQNVVSQLVYKFLNTRLPASLFYGEAKLLKYYNMFDDEEGKTHQVFQGFICKGTGDRAPTNRAYFRNVLDNYSEYLGKLDERPKAVSVDGSEPAFGVFDSSLYARDAQSHGSLTYEDSTLVRTVLEPMDTDQRDFYTAWIYAMFMHLEVVISLLHEDKGGTMKTTLKKIIRIMIERYYGADLTLIMQRDQLCMEQYLYDSKRMLSVADGMFVDYDEPTTRGELWEKLKSLTGGNGVDFQVKVLYSNPFTVHGNPLFWFCSNKPIYISDKEAFRRRLAVISTSASNTWKNNPIDKVNAVNKDIDVQLDEFHLLMRMGKKAYDELTAKYGTLSNAANNLKSLTNELDSQSPWEEYLEGFYFSLFEDNQERRVLTNTDLDELFSMYKESNYTPLKFDPPHWRNYCRHANPLNESGKVYDKKLKRSVRGCTYYRNEVEAVDENTLTADDITAEKTKPISFMEFHNPKEDALSCL